MCWCVDDTSLGGLSYDTGNRHILYHLGVHLSTSNFYEPETLCRRITADMTNPYQQNFFINTQRPIHDSYIVIAMDKKSSRSITTLHVTIF